MKLKDYARSHKKRKQFVSGPDLFLVGADVSKAKQHVCFDQTNYTLTFANSQEDLNNSNKLYAKTSILPAPVQA